MTSFIVLLLAYILSQFFRSFLAVVSGDLVRDLGLDQGQLGSLQAAWLIAFALSQFPVGYALDRIGPRRTLAGFLLVAVAGTVIFGLSQSYAMALTALAYMWLKMARTAQAKVAAGEADPFYRTKLATGRYFIERVLPETSGRLAKLKSGAAPVMDLAAEAF